jgi:hypothetical protein
MWGEEGGRGEVDGQGAGVIHPPPTPASCLHVRSRERLESIRTSKLWQAQAEYIGYLKTSPQVR